MSSTADRLLPMVTEAVGIYGTAPTCYLSALARMDGFTMDALDRAIEEDRSLVRARTMRYSVYTLPHELLVPAVTAARRKGLQFTTHHLKVLGDAYGALADAVEDALADGPLTSLEIRERVDPDRELKGKFSLLLGRMGAESRIVRATSGGGWRSDGHSYARWADWLPELDPFGMDEAHARRIIAEAYVAAYGPVELDDLYWWTGWTKAEAREAADGLDLGAAGVATERLGGVRLLPVWDVLMVAYRNRDRLLDPEHARFIYDARGNATSVVLDGGRVAGVWDLGKDDDPLAIRVAPLDNWPQRRWDDVEAQADRIAAMIGAAQVGIMRMDGPVDLQAAPRNTFMAPLS